MDIIASESITVRLVTDKPIRKTPYQVKGVFMKQFPDEKIVPFLDGRLRSKYLYPRVQVKIINEQIYIIFELPNYKLRVGNFLNRKEAENFQKKIVRLGYRTAWVVPTMIEKDD